MNFFIRFSNEIPDHRAYLLSPGGIPLLVEHAKSKFIDVEYLGNYDTVVDIWHLATTILSASALDLYAPILVQCDICPALVRFLVWVTNTI